MTADEIVKTLLVQRGYSSPDAVEEFLNPKYQGPSADVFKLPDIKEAVERIESAIKNRQNIIIYGDYDIDGLTATTLLTDALSQMGGRVSSYIPDRFNEGYGLNRAALTKLKDEGADLVITVDCGSVSHEAIEHANSIGLDVIVTDHHTVGDRLPKAVAIVNPKRDDHTYEFNDFAGVGVAFKLVQALQLHMGALSEGQEKWLLDLVALGTVCDVVSLTGENRQLVYWGLEVLKKTRRPGLKALMDVSKVVPVDVCSVDLGFRLGPRLNAAGRLEHARRSLELLQATEARSAKELAQKLQGLNHERQQIQQKILNEAREQAQKSSDPVLVLAGKNWSHGVVGIVAAKIMEEYKKPTFVLELMDDQQVKGSARSFGDFKAVEAVRACDDFIISGGGHAAAAGCTLLAKDLAKFRKKINDFYVSQKLSAQDKYMDKKPNIILNSFSAINRELLQKLKSLEPYGRGNEEPVFEFNNVEVVMQKGVGADGKHLKLRLKDKAGLEISGISFNSKALNATKLKSVMARLTATAYDPLGVELMIVKATA